LLYEYCAVMGALCGLARGQDGVWPFAGSEGAQALLFSPRLLVPSDHTML